MSAQTVCVREVQTHFCWKIKLQMLEEEEGDYGGYKVNINNKKHQTFFLVTGLSILLHYAKSDNRLLATLALKHLHIQLFSLIFSSVSHV